MTILTATLPASSDGIQCTNDPNFIHLFFALGKIGGVPTTNGLFTPKAILVIAIFNTGDKNNKYIWKLLDKHHCLVKGYIPSLNNATLLHIAYMKRSAADITKLLSCFGSE